MKIVFVLAIAFATLAICSGFWWRRHSSSSSSSYKHRIHGGRSSSSSSYRHKRIFGGLFLKKKCKIGSLLHGFLKSKHKVLSYVFSGHSVTYSCNPGYRLEGSASQKCYNGEWVGSCRCVQAYKKCQVKDTISSGYTTPGYNHYVAHNDYVEYSCDYGYILQGYASRKCNDGDFEGSVPYCKAIQCDVLEAPSGGAIVGVPQNPADVGDEVTYYCQGGYELEGTATLTCQDDGNFSPSVPTCRRVYRSCGYPLGSKHSNQNVQVVPKKSHYAHSSSVEFICDKYYTLASHSAKRATCNNGVWNYSPSYARPSCVKGKYSH